MEKHIPEHVPADLLVDLDIYDLPDDGADAHAAWQQFRGHGPLVYSPYNGGHWVAVDGHDIVAMWRDPQTYSSWAVGLPDHGMSRQIPIEIDPPEHSEYRANIARFFTPSEVNRLEPEIRALAVRLIEGFRARGECEFIGEFAEQLPLIVFLTLMGLPQEDRIPLHAMVEAFARHPDLKIKQDAYNGLRHYLDDWIEKRLANPGSDVISFIARAEIGGRPYTRDEALSTCTLALLGGLDTVASSLGFWALHLARHPAQRAAIRQSGQGTLLQIINEFLRRFPIPNLSRVVTRDLVHRGVQMKKGDRILLSPSLHNLDPALYPDPFTVDFDRKPRHVTFGAGPHMCAGANLARCEFKIFLEEWLTRIPEFRVKPGTTPVMKAAPTNTVEELWLVWP
jgi:cytochrome P450